MTSHRKERVESFLMEEISTILRQRIQDPRVRNVHIVSVKVSADLSSARVNYSTLAETDDVEKIQKGLDSAKHFIRSEVKKAIQMRKIPEVFFVFDPSIREGDRILGLLRKIEPPKPAGGEPPVSPPPEKPDTDADPDSDGE